jgi:hypothetical protein
VVKNILGAALALGVICALASTAQAHDREHGACSSTSRLMQSACSAEVRDDFYVETAKCLNEKEYAEQRECRREARQEYRESLSGCGEQFEARQNVCAAIGEAPYDPSFEAEDFETSLAAVMFPNNYYPFQVGYQWIYGGDEDIQVDVLDESKLIDDIRCFVVQDVVTEDGKLVEDTDDWFAVSKIDGAIWYCGEEVKDYEYFEGDVPSLPELVAIDGSFKVERDGDRAGVAFPVNPQVGDVYRQEFSLGNAEDVAEIVSTTYGWGTDPDLDELVPQELAEYLCNNDCIVVAEYTPIEPGVFERKYYAPGIGFFLATNPEDDESVQLTDCNFNALCDGLPEPD